MRPFLIFIFLFCSSNLLFSQFEDTIIFKSKEFIIVKSFKTNRYTIRNELNGQIISSDLKFIKEISSNSYFQVLDNNNEIYYVDDKFKKMDPIRIVHNVCGNVPHYKLYIKDVGENILIMEEDATFYHKNKNSALEIVRVAKAQADEILFINGKDLFDFTADFFEKWVFIDPRTIILLKNGKFSFLKQPEKDYDAVYFSKIALKTQKNNLYGYYGIVEPKYKSISEFKYFLAIVTFEDGTTGYLDYLGNEYK